MPNLSTLLASLDTLSAGTTVPWFITFLGLLVVLSLLVAFRYWREAKRSPYFFQRRQAEQNLQSYLTAGFVLSLVTILTAAYVWEPVPDATARVAILSNNKPPTAEVIEVVEQTEALPPMEEVEALAEAVAESEGALTTNGQGIPTLRDVFATGPTLPAEFDRFDATTELNETTELSPIAFTTDVTDELAPVSIEDLFAEGFYTLFATFDYEAMADGMTWSWVWRHNDRVVEGGNEVWQYGEQGPGYIYFEPEEGFQAGEYSLEVWVNGELLTQGRAVMNDAAVAANN